MDAAYCGKDCRTCARQMARDCPGCRMGPGRFLQDGCEIAACCRNKGHEHCGTCTQSSWCGKRSRRDDMPERRERKLAAEAARRAEMARRAPFLGRWLWLLFWLVIPSTVASLLSADVIADWAPRVYQVGELLGVVCSVAYGLILLKLSAECENYRTAGILRLVTAALSLLLALASGAGSGGTWTLVISLPAAVVSLVGTYQEYQAHAEVLCDTDALQAEKWRRLWKWNIGTLVAVFAGVFLMLIFAILGLLVVLAALIGQLVVSVLALVYLYRTAQIFREFPDL